MFYTFARGKESYVNISLSDVSRSRVMEAGTEGHALSDVEGDLTSVGGSRGGNASMLCNDSDLLAWRSVCGVGMTPHKPFSRRPFACNRYNEYVEKKIFWIVLIVLGLVADVVLPIWWGLLATIPIAFVSWWVAYRSEWF
jgi:hypothetical protein